MDNPIVEESLQNERPNKQIKRGKAEIKGKELGMGWRGRRVFNL